jgi:hypothetical protein
MNYDNSMHNIESRMKILVAYTRDIFSNKFNGIEKIKREYASLFEECHKKYEADEI